MFDVRYLKTKLLKSNKIELDKTIIVKFRNNL